MAWSWSHTQEAYDYARSQLSTLQISTIIECAAEWKVLRDLQASNPDVEPWDMPLSTSTYIRKMRAARKLYMACSPDDVIDWVWDNMEQAATCDNGGFNAWVDPEGYITVPFSPPSTVEV